MSPRFPNSDGLFELFTKLTDYLVETIDTLRELIEAPASERAELYTKLHEAEHAADLTSHAITRFVNNSFILPFDHEDVHKVTDLLDDVIDRVDEAGSNMVLYNPTSLPQGSRRQLEILHEAGASTHRIVNAFDKLADNIFPYWESISTLEDEADKLYRSMIAEMFDTSEDALEIMRVQMVLDSIEDAVDAFEELSGTLEMMALKDL